MRQTVDAGFACLPGLICDPGLRALSGLPEFDRLRAEVEQRHQRSFGAFEAVGGHAVLEIPLKPSTHLREECHSSMRPATTGDWF